MVIMSKPVGWRNEPYRHSLAARGLDTTPAMEYRSGMRSPECVIDQADKYVIGRIIEVMGAVDTGLLDINECRRLVRDLIRDMEENKPILTAAIAVDGERDPKLGLYGLIFMKVQNVLIEFTLTGKVRGKEITYDSLVKKLDLLLGLYRTMTGQRGH